MTIATDVINKARECLGVRFRHQGRSKQTGFDCLGLVIYSINSLGLSTYDYTTYQHYPPVDLLAKTMAEKLIPIPVEELVPGCVLRFKVGAEAIHVGIATDVGVIHAYAPTRQVVEHRLDDYWLSKIVSVYKIPGVSY